jgi:hypothetical protein
MRSATVFLRGRFLPLLVCTAPVALASVDGRHMSILPTDPGPRGERTVEQAAIERQPVCIGSSVMSAGALSNILYYRAVVLADGHIEVGYFAFFSEERPWGNNWMTWSLVPALAVDLVYSRALLVAPGLQRALYGKGDVEGVRVKYAVLADGSLRLERAVADDATEGPVVLSTWSGPRSTAAYGATSWGVEAPGYAPISTTCAATRRDRSGR